MKTCLSCIQNLFLHLPFPNNNCLDICPLSFFANKITGTCQSCKSSCLSCESENICNSCIKGFFFLGEDKDCVSKCPDSFYLSEESETCLKCSSKCKTCEKKEDICITCNEGFFLDDNNSCVEKCKDGYYGDLNDNICKKCDVSCLTCKGSLDHHCLTCDNNNGLKLIGGFCTNKCKGNFINKKNSEECIDLNACFEYLLLNAPKTFSIQQNSYKANIIYKL